MATTVSKVVPFLWFGKEAEEAVRFYVSLIPNSSVDNVWVLQADSPSGPPGSVKVVEFKLGGVEFNAMQAGPMDQFNHSVSFVINCDDQAEVDRLWDALGEGGSYEACGWLKDKYGVSWQIVPTELINKDKARAGRVADAMLKMVKLEIGPLRKAYEGTKAA
jgi:predicted 3-demethylubiquinone-9 3-methyltransferase (glyoxalase superfamily)